MNNIFNLTFEERKEKTFSKVPIRELINFESNLDKNITVSIVIPICNVEKYLDKCLDSVVHQTLDSFEIICVNDGSKDNSLNICKKYAEKYKNIRIIDKDNAGYGHTLNIGMDMAKGKYIGIVESDDYIKPQMFQTLYRVAEKNKLDLVKSDFLCFKTNSGKQVAERKYTATDMGYGKVIDAKKNLKVFHYLMNTWTGLYKTEFLRGNIIRHNETPGASYQDNGFWFQTLALAKRSMFLKKAFYYYRQDNPNSSINSKGKIFCMCDEYSYIYDFLCSQPDLKKQLMPVYISKKFFNYLYTYNRLAPEFKLQFLERFSAEFKESLFNEELDTSDLDSNTCELLFRIIDDYNYFYYSDTIYVQQHWYENVLQSEKQFVDGWSYKISNLLIKMLRRKP